MLSDRELAQIGDLVAKIIDVKLEEMTKDIVKGFVETIDWHNENFAKIMQERNQKTIEAMYKQEVERIEIETRTQAERDAAKKETERKEAERASRIGFEKGITK